MALNNQTRFVRDSNLEKVVNQLIIAKSIDTWEGSIVVVKDLDKKAPKDLSKFDFGCIKAVKGADACLLPDVRYKVIIYDQAWQALKPNNQKIALLYLLNQVRVNDKTGEPDLYRPDIKGFKAFIRKYGMDWLWSDDVKDPLLTENKQSVGVSNRAENINE